MHGLRPDWAYRWSRVHRFAAVGVLLCVAVLRSAGADAGVPSILSFLADSAQDARRLADEGAAAAAAIERTTAAGDRAASAAATAAARVTPDGALAVTIYTGGKASSEIAVHSAADLTRVAAQISGPILVAPDVLKRFNEEFVELLQQREGAVEVVTQGSAPAPVQVSLRAKRPALIVALSSDLTFTIDAWARRDLLAQEIMKDLAARLKVIVMAPATDQVQRQAFVRALGQSRVSFVESPQALSSAVAKADKRLVVVVSHMEGENLVLRQNGAVVFQQSIEAVHAAVDEARSVGLVLGCHSACSAAVTGPTDYIDALELTSALASTSSYVTPLDFLQGLTRYIGPMHVDTDVYGRLRAVSDAHVTAAERTGKLAGYSFQFLMPGAAAEPLTVAGVITIVLAVMFLIPQGILFGWLVVILGAGMSPRKAWQTIKALYAQVLERGDHEIEHLSGAEKLLLSAAGPWLLAGVWVCMVWQFTLNLPLLFTALLLYPFLRLLSPQTLELSRKIAPDARNRSKISFRDGRETALLGYLLLTALFAGAAALHAALGVPGGAAAAAEALLAVISPVVAFSLAAVMLRRSPKKVAAMVNLRRGLVVGLFFLLRLPFRISRRVWPSLPGVLKKPAVSARP